MIKYLTDSLQSYETGYSDALCPVRKEAEKSFMGEHALLRPATYNDLQQFMNLVISTIQTGFSTSYNRPGTCAACCCHQVPGSEPPANTQHYAVVSQPIHSAVQTRQQSHQPEAATRTIGDGQAGPLAPLASACIPDIPRGKGNWRKAVEQWDSFLRDWPTENYTGRMRIVSASKRMIRQTIAEEYDR